MLHKKSGLKFEQVRERYEHFRSRYTIDLADAKKVVKLVKKKKKKKTKKERKRLCRAIIWQKVKMCY